MKKDEIIEQLKTLSANSESTTVRSLLNTTIRILEMSPRRIEGFISLISGFSDKEVHKASSEKRGIFQRKNRKLKL